jgi:hypothetical protein
MDPTPVRPPSLLDPQLLWAIGALIATLLLGALIFAWLDRWRKRGERNTPGATPAQQLTAFRQSYERGELSQEEYERVKAKLAPKVRQQMNLPPKPESAQATPKPGFGYGIDPRALTGSDGHNRGNLPPAAPNEPTTDLPPPVDH